MLSNNVLAFFNMGTSEILIILFLILLLFGAKRIPDLARGFGKGIREFKDATKEIKSEIENTTNEIKK